MDLREKNQYFAKSFLAFQKLDVREKNVAVKLKEGKTLAIFQIRNALVTRSPPPTKEKERLKFTNRRHKIWDHYSRTKTFSHHSIA